MCSGPCDAEYLQFLESFGWCYGLYAVFMCSLQYSLQEKKLRQPQLGCQSIVRSQNFNITSFLTRTYSNLQKHADMGRP